MLRPRSGRRTSAPGSDGGAPARATRSRLLWAALVALVALAGGLRSGRAAAQESKAGSDQRAAADSTATLVGQVVSAMTGGPLSGARVVLKRSGYGAITDSSGDFRIRGVPAGFVDTLQVDLIGYANQSIPLKIKAGSTTRAILSLSETVLRVEDLHVEVKASPLRSSLSEFHRHQKTGMGYFITPEMIEQQDPTYASDILRRVPGVTVAAQVNGKSEVHMVHSNLNCYPTLYLDGAPWPRHNLDELNPGTVLAMEVYRGTSEIPSRFMGMGRPDCGVIVVWTRQGGAMDSVPADGG